MNPNIKYQIFVSSTYEDLKDEREKVIKAILEMGHIPVGMEMFSASDEQQWKLIQRQIDDCDYYVVIVAHKYGSLDGEISYTEKEYDYAATRSTPILGFIIDSKAKITAAKMESDAQKKEKLENFKNKVKTKIISYWESKEDLYGKVPIALMKQFNTNSQVGWIRANEVVGANVTKELSRLSTENSTLREQIAGLQEKINQDDISKYDKIIVTLKNHSIKFGFRFADSMEYKSSKTFSFYKLFTLIAPETISKDNKIQKDWMSGYLGKMLNPQYPTEINSKNPIGFNIIHMILTDLQVLGLFLPYKGKGEDANKYWSITEEGIKVYYAIRKRIMEGIDT